MAYTRYVSVSEENKGETATSCNEALKDDLGWGLGKIFRFYVSAANAAMSDLPGGSRGYQVLAAASRGNVASQLALAQLLGVDRTVMTYLLDDLESAKLIERCAAPTDRRVRRIIATRAGREVLEAVSDKLAMVEEQLLTSLNSSSRESFRLMIQQIATRVEDREQPLVPCDVEADMAALQTLV